MIQFEFKNYLEDVLMSKSVYTENLIFDIQINRTCQNDRNGLYAVIFHTLKIYSQLQYK